MTTASDFRHALEIAIFLSKYGINSIYVNEPMFDRIVKDLSFNLHDANGQYYYDHKLLYVVKGDKHTDYLFIPNRMIL